MYLALFSDISLEKILRLFKYVMPIAQILGFLALGIIVEKQLWKYCRKIARRSGQENLLFIVASFRGIITTWFVLAGISTATLNLNIKPSIANFLGKAILVVVLLSITLYISRLAIGFIELFNTARGDEHSAQLTTLFENLTRVVIFLIGILVTIQSLGIAITPLVTALGIGGVSVGLALKSTFSNLFSSINILTAKKARPGDYIELNTGEQGYIQDITWKHTILEDIYQNWHIIPNNQLADSSFTNYSLPTRAMFIEVEIGIAYESDLEKVEKITLEVAAEISQELKSETEELKPFIRYTKFDYFSINLLIYLPIQEFFDQLIIKHELIKRLHKRYRQEKIKIPFPIKSTYLPKSSDKLKSLIEKEDDIEQLLDS